MAEAPPCLVVAVDFVDGQGHVVMEFLPWLKDQVVFSCDAPQDMEEAVALVDGHGHDMVLHFFASCKRNIHAQITKLLTGNPNCLTNFNKLWKTLA